MPKSIAGDITLMFSLFSDAIPSRIDSLTRDAFEETEMTNDSANTLIKVFFSENGNDYTVTYDRRTGIPRSLDVGNDEFSVSVILSDFNITETQNT